MGESEYKCPYCGEWRGEWSFKTHLFLVHGNISGEGNFTRVITYQPPTKRNGTMDTNIVPVTEAEMTGFFQRVTTTFVGLSRQAAELEEVKKQVSSLHEQVTSLRGENSKLKGDLDAAVALASENENKLNDARRHRDDLQARANSLTETIVARDSRVKELEGLNTTANLALEDEKRAHDYTKARIQHLESDLSLVRERRNHWQDRAERAEQELAEVQAKLSKVVEQMTTMSDILGVVKSAPEKVEQVAEQAKEAAQQADPTGIATEASPEPAKPWWEQERKTGTDDNMPF